MHLKDMTIGEWLKIAGIVAAIGSGWLSLTLKVSALEEKTKPVPQMHTDIEVVKAAVIDIKDGIKEMRQEMRRRR